MDFTDTVDTPDAAETTPEEIAAEQRKSNVILFAALGLVIIGVVCDLFYFIPYLRMSILTAIPEFPIFILFVAGFVLMAVCGCMVDYARRKGMGSPVLAVIIEIMTWAMVIIALVGLILWNFFWKDLAESINSFLFNP